MVLLLIIFQAAVKLLPIVPRVLQCEAYLTCFMGPNITILWKMKSRLQSVCHF